MAARSGATPAPAAATNTPANGSSNNGSARAPSPARIPATHTAVRPTPGSAPPLIPPFYRTDRERSIGRSTKRTQRSIPPACFRDERFAAGPDAIVLVPRYGPPPSVKPQPVHCGLDNRTNFIDYRYIDYR